MALVPATLTINFTSNYAGPHRVCYRLNGTGAYDCTTVVTCTGGGALCTATINIMVDNETCDPVQYDGYVQATCEDIGSLVGRVPFVITFTPNPTCKGYTISCASVSVLDYTVGINGSGYNPAIPPIVTVAPGPGIGATATAVVSDNGILTVNTLNAGAGYVNGTYNLVPAQTISGVGSGALFTVVVAGGAIASVTLATPLNAGTDYAVNDAFDFNAANLGGAGAGGLFSVLTVDYGRVIDVVLSTGGSGYVTAPAVTIAAPGAGVTATATSVLGTCAAYNAGNNCDATPKANITLALGESTIVCTPVVPPAPENPTSGITIVQDACCYDCTSYTVELGEGDQSRVIYTDCATRNQVKTTITGPFTGTVCMVTGSLLVQYISGTPAIVTTGAAC